MTQASSPKTVNYNHQVLALIAVIRLHPAKATGIEAEATASRLIAALGLTLLEKKGSIMSF